MYTVLSEHTSYVFNCHTVHIWAFWVGGMTGLQTGPKVLICTPSNYRNTEAKLILPKISPFQVDVYDLYVTINIHVNIYIYLQLLIFT